MEYFSGFHWWYVIIPVALLLVFISRSGKVSRQYEVELKALDAGFQSCTPEVRLSLYENTRETHLEIDIQELNIPVGDNLEILHNGSPLATIMIAFDGEAEYDLWGNENNPLPDIRPGDELVINYHGKPVLKGRFIQTI